MAQEETKEEEGDSREDEDDDDDDTPYNNNITRRKDITPYNREEGNAEAQERSRLALPAININRLDSEAVDMGDSKSANDGKIMLNSSNK